MLFVSGIKRDTSDLGLQGLKPLLLIPLFGWAKQVAEKLPECVIPRSGAARILSFARLLAQRDSSLRSE
jgi:hypothetical protein